MASQTSSVDRAGSPSPASALRLRDLLRADVAGLKRALQDDPHQRSSGGRRLRRAVRWLEHHGEHRMKVLYCPPLPLLWSALPGDGSPASVIHKAYLRELWRERGAWGRAKLLGATLVLWPLLNGVLIAWLTFLNGSEIRERTGVTIRRQVWQQIQVSALDAVLPPWYYTFDLHDDALRRQAADYLHRHETKGGLYRLVNRQLRVGEKTSLQDKWKYAQRCREHGIRTIPIVATARDGLLRFHEPGRERLPDADLFLKPIKGRGGEGADWWHSDGVGSFTSSGGERKTAEQLAEHAAALSRRQPYLVTERARNHSDIADLSNGALCTLRIVTIRTPEGGHEATDAVFRMGVGNTIVDNFHAGGIACNVDLYSGQLGPATDLGLRPERGWCDVHPTTGGKIAGRRLPHWPETIELVERAHAGFSDHVIIGWDVAILDDGPCIVESNGSPDLDIHQRCARAPLGRRRLGQLLALHVEHALALARGVETT